MSELHFERTIPVGYQLTESAIVSGFAADVARRLARQAITRLRGMKDSLLAGEDSGLESAWDEICVQVQGEESYVWDAYTDIISSLLAQQLRQLPKYQQEAIWLQSEEGEDWSQSGEDEREPDPVIEDESVGYLLTEHVLAAASSWTNARIRRFLDSQW